MTQPFRGAIDCDLHAAVPNTAALLPHLDPFWRDQVETRYIDRLPFPLMSYPPNAPKSCRLDWRVEGRLPGGDLAALQRDAIDAFGTSIAICNVLHGGMTLFNEDLAAAMTRAVNDWTARELLDREARLRASILVTPQNVSHAVAEIERVAQDRRFVQVLLLVQNEMMLGRRALWPIYAAAEAHDLPVGVHAGGMYRFPTTAHGWPSYQVEDYVVQATAFQNQLVSLVTEGVFSRHPRLKVVFIESGFTWLPSWMWRMDKTWRGARAETPWIDRPPSQIVRDHVRFTLQPFDAPPEATLLERILEQAGSDELLLFSTDYPHWQFEALEAMPQGLPDRLRRKILVDNALATYPRLLESRLVANPSAKEVSL